jgi:hypothetical protein
MSMFGSVLQAAALLIPGLNVYVAAAMYVAGAAISIKEQRDAQRRVYNASLKDRTVMLQAQVDAPRTMVLGRVRSVEGMRRPPWTTGTHSEKLTMIVSFASHEIDAFERFYADDTPLDLDGDGWVTTERWTKGRLTGAQQSGVLNGSGAATFTLAQTPTDDGSAVEIDAGGGASPLGVSRVGLTVTVSGGHAGQEFSYTYSWRKTTAVMRIRAFNGSASQDIYASIGAEYPGKLRGTDHFRGVALAVIDLIYDQDVYPQGIPNFTALMRGAKVLDPRTNLTAWSENPALLAYHWARHAKGMAIPAGEIRTADIDDAANTCAVSTDFDLTMPDTSVDTVTLPRYRCGIVIDLTGNPRDALDQIVQTMAGRWGWAGGALRIRAGAFATPAFALDASWVAQRMNDTGEVDESPVVRITNSIPREQRINRIAGTCIDPATRWLAAPFPAVEDAAAIAADGETYETELALAGVTHIAHAQHLARVRLREQRAPLRMEMACNVSAYKVELFDTGSVTLPRFGMSGKTVEAIGWKWSPREGVTLTLAELTAAIFDVGSITGRDPAPNTTLPSPWIVEDLTGLNVSSGIVALTDGSILTRTLIEWDAVTQQSVRAAGQIEVQYWDVATALPDDDWLVWTEQGGATRAVIPGLMTGHAYVFRARAVQTLPFVRGEWSDLVLVVIAAPPTADLNRDFTSGADGWTGLTSASTGVSGATAGTAALMTNNAVLETSRRQPIDTSKLYRVRSRLKCLTGAGGAFYVGVGCFDVNGSPITNAAGAAHPYPAASGAPLPADGQWHLFEGFVTGTHVVPDAGAGANEFWQGTAQAAPMVFATGHTGTYLVDYVELLDVSPATLGRNVYDSGGILLADGDVLNTEITIAGDGTIAGIGTGAGSQVKNNLDAAGLLHIARPIGGQYAYDAPITGALRIKLPRGFTNAMVRFVVTVYEYASGAVQTYEVGGYAYSATNSWYNIAATFVGAPSKSRRVQFGSSGGKATIWIGEVSTVWQYPKVLITDVIVGYGDVVEANWSSGWAISFDTGAPTGTLAEVSGPRAGGALTLLDQVDTAQIAANAATSVLVANVAGPASLGYGLPTPTRANAVIYVDVPAQARACKLRVSVTFNTAVTFGTNGRGGVSVQLAAIDTATDLNSVKWPSTGGQVVNCPPNFIASSSVNASATVSASFDYNPATDNPRSIVMVALNGDLSPYSTTASISDAHMVVEVIKA